MRSVQAWLGTGLLISLVILFSVQWLIVSVSIRYLTEDYVASRLRADSESLLAAVRIGAPGSGPIVDSERLASAYQRPFSGHYYRIGIGKMVMRSRSLWDEDLQVPILSTGEHVRLKTPGPRGHHLLLLVSGYKKTDRDVTIAVAEDLSAIEGDIRRFQYRYGFISLAILLILVVLQRRIVKAGFASLDKAREDIAKLEIGEIRHLREDSPDEIRPFIREINRLLQAMGRRLQRSRNALGNLAHALKGPLTLLMQLADREEVAGHASVRSELIEQSGRIRSILERELKRARLAGIHPPGHLPPLDEEIRHLLDALRRIHHEKELEIRHSMPSQSVIRGDREDILELLGNLLDNAFKWARRRVSLVVENGSGLRLSVEDDGPGCPPEELERLSIRGVRIDESSPGYGLGLAISRDIVEQYGGEIGFGRSERLGGFQVRVKLPPYRSEALT